MDMTTKKLRGPDSNRAATAWNRQPQVSEKRLEQIRDELKKAFDNGLKPQKLIECEPQGKEERRLSGILGREIEPRLRDLALDRPVSVSVGGIDKSRQNPLNKLGGVDGLGNAAIKAYWDMTLEAIAAVAKVNEGEEIGMHLARVAPRSDEGVLLIGGENLTEDIKVQFHEAWKMARARKDLSQYTYTIELPGEAGMEKFHSNLDAFSEVLQHKDMVVACSHAISRPITVTADTEKGFILDEVRKLENEEVAAFYENLPKSFKGNGGMPEVHSPFRSNLLGSGFERMSGGTFVEIKLRIPDEDAGALLWFTDDTRKGYAEIFSHLVGMRALNTFIGKPRTNCVLTPITQALGEMKKEHDIAVLPVTGAYMQYWLDLPARNGTAELVKKAIERRIHSKMKDMGYIDLPFEPVVSMMDATDVNLSDVRARFILKSLGKDLYPSSILEDADFMVNFVENIEEPYQRKIYEQLALGTNGGKPLQDLDNIDMMREVCAARRTIRDTEDIVWTLRKDESLPGRIKAKRKVLERWLFEFSWEKVSRMRLLLARKIKAEMQQKEKQARELLRVVQ